MKVTIDIPFESITGEPRDEIDELNITLLPNSSLEELVQAFKTIMYAQTYHPDTIEETFGGE